VVFLGYYRLHAPHAVKSAKNSDAGATPPLQLNDRLNTLAQNAALALGRLDALSKLLPDPQVFLYSKAHSGRWPI
jgi:hypothetical protein